MVQHHRMAPAAAVATSVDGRWRGCVEPLCQGTTSCEYYDRKCKDPAVGCKQYSASSRRGHVRHLALCRGRIACACAISPTILARRSIARPFPAARHVSMPPALPPAQWVALVGYTVRRATIVAALWTAQTAFYGMPSGAKLAWPIARAPQRGSDEVGGANGCSRLTHQPSFESCRPGSAVPVRGFRAPPHRVGIPLVVVPPAIGWPRVGRVAGGCCIRDVRGDHFHMAHGAVPYVGDTSTPHWGGAVIEAALKGLIATVVALEALYVIAALALAFSAFSSYPAESSPLHYVFTSTTRHPTVRDGPPSGKRAACPCLWRSGRVRDHEVKKRVDSLLDPTTLNAGWRRPSPFGGLRSPEGTCWSGRLNPAGPCGGLMHPASCKTSSLTTANRLGNSPIRASPGCCACSSIFPGASSR